MSKLAVIPLLPNAPSPRPAFPVSLLALQSQNLGLSVGLHSIPPYLKLQIERKMFTEGLDQNAIQWIKQGADTGRETRSPLTENLHRDDIPGPFPMRSTSSYLSSPPALPPLKFHSGLLGPHSLATLSLYDNSDSNYEDDDETDDDEEESVASAPDEMENYSETSVDQHSAVDVLEDLPWHTKHGQVDGFQESTVIPIVQSRSTINRGLSQLNLKVQVPSRLKALDDVGSLSGHSQKYMTPHSVQVTPIHQTRFYDAMDLGTPSAPPVIGSEQEIDDGINVSSEKRAGSDVVMDEEIGEADHTQVLKYPSMSRHNEFKGENQTAHQQTETEAPHCRTSSFAPSLCYNASGQQAWQVLVAYDACIRLCLHAWARGCPDAPEFLRDECLLLRSAFGLNNFLLQPHGVKPIKEENTNSSTSQICSSKPTKVVGKIRVEVKKLRIIPQRKLKGTFSQRGGLYMQVGAEYVRQVSSYVKTGINSIKNSSSLMTCEDPMSCLLHLKSSAEDSPVESVSVVCLRPGTGDHHDLFPESQRDALVIEVQDSKHVIHGQAVISISSLADASNDKLRWWPLYHDEHECVGKVQLFATSTFTSEEEKHIKSGPVVETLAYDLLLDAAMRAEQFQSQSLQLGGPWKWLLTEFSQYYGVSDSYTKLRYLSHVMNVATPTKDCLELVQDLLVTVIKARSERKLNRQEKGILLDCEMQVESLLANVFENYKSLDELSPTGLSNLLTPIPEFAPPAFAAAVQVYTLLHDILAQDGQKILQCYLQTAAKKRCRKHMMETDEFLSSNSSDNILADPMAISTAYLKMKNLCSNLSSEIHADIKIHNQHLLPTAIDLSNITAAVYSTELSRRLKGFLAACPPSSPLPHVNALLQATDDFQRDLESWDISPIQGGVNSKSLFDDYIMVWVQDMQLGLLDLCKAEKVPWSGVVTNHSTSPFVENMYLKIKEGLDQYDVVISRWPQYSLVLENAVADVERAIIKSLQRQYSEILTPLKDSIPKKLGIQVQKLARRQSMTLYSVPNQLGTFLNSLKRILDVLHCSIEQILKSWASLCPPIVGDQKSFFGEQMNDIKVLLRTKYKNYMQAVVAKLYANMQASRGTQLKKILEETQDSDGESEIRERMQMLNAQLIDSISNLHEVFTSQIFVALCRGFWDRMGQSVLKFLEGRKENRVWYKGSYYALGILDDTFASQMQRLQGNALLEKDLDPPQSVVEARSILCRDASHGTHHQSSTYFYY